MSGTSAATSLSLTRYQAERLRFFMLPRYVVFVRFPDDIEPSEPSCFYSMMAVRQFTNIIEAIDDIEYHVYKLEEVYSWKLQ